ncbi:MAG: mannose-6-phosphate isomerase, class I [Lentisphaeria bacterium]
MKHQENSYSPSLLPLRCGIQHYAWGERPAAGHHPLIAALAGVAPQPDQPFAELWIGAHPNCPATVVTPTGDVPLPEFIRHHPRTVLGPGGGRDLPFLLKILTAGSALSIQAHPNKPLAARLHARLPQHYPDANHKPEIAIALSEFDALCQFRPSTAIRRDLERWAPLHAFFGDLPARPAKAWLKAAYARLFQAPAEAMRQLVEAQVNAVRQAGPRTPHDQWFLELARQYPGDRGAVSLYFLNLVHLQPGEALFLAADEPHAYLKGAIIECMASSDNVVRAGLTPKFIDTETLLGMLTYRQGGAPRLRPRTSARGDRSYLPPVPEFAVDWWQRERPARMKARSQGAVSLLLVLAGRAELRTPQGDSVTAERGSTWLWPAAVPEVEIAFREPGTQLVRARPNSRPA